MKHSEHVTDEVFDYLEGRLPADRTRAVRAHLSICADCAEVYAQAESLHEDVVRLDARHIHPERLLQINEGNPQPATRTEQAHLEKCALCQVQLDWLRSLPEPSVVEAENPDPTPTRPHDKRR